LNQKKHILIIFLFCFSCFSIAQKVNLKFNHYYIDDGLSQNTINIITEDKDGFLWIGTDDGLNKFDGLEYKVYQYNIYNKNSISNNQITALEQDSEGNMWVGTIAGLNKINLKTNIITRFQTDSLITNHTINTIKQLNANKIWIATNKGLRIYDLDKKTFSKPTELDYVTDKSVTDFVIDKNKNVWIATRTELFCYNTITKNISSLIKSDAQTFFNKLIIDHKNNIWIGSNTGLQHYNPLTKKLKRFTTDQNNSISNNEITSLFEDKNHTLWIGTESGLNEFDLQNNQFTIYTNEIRNPKSLSYDIIYSLFQDSSGVLWIGTYNGLNSVLLEQKLFNHFSISPKYQNNYNSNLVWNFEKDKQGNLWIATSNGIHIYNKKNDTLKSISSQVGNQNNAIIDIYALRFDQFDNLWAGGVNGIHYIPHKDVYNIWTKKSIVLKKVKNEHLDSVKKIAYFTEVKELNEMWISSLSDGLVKVSNLTKNLDELDVNMYKASGNKETSLTSNATSAIVKSTTNDLWIATRKGLNKYNYKTQQFSYFNFDKDPNSEIEISSLNLQNDSTLWVGTFTSGIIKFNTNTHKYSFITTKNGLANNSIYSIRIPDHERELWLSTNRGISKYTIASGDIKNFSSIHGLQDNEFSEGSDYKDNEGILYFGGINGFNSFHPDSIIPNQALAKISLNELKIFDKTARVNYSNKVLGISDDDKIILTKDISKTDSLTLSYNHSVFSFKISTLHFQNPKENKFAYKLEGFDKDWIIRNAKKNQFTYTNLDPGTYTLKLKAANSDGLWNETPKQLIITISPPYWNTLWFYWLISIALVTLTYLILQFWKNQIKHKQRRIFLKKENDQKTNMLKEIHHRVKNNLQIVNSLLRIQSSKIKDENIVQMFKKTQRRVLSMAILHEKMYQSENLKNLNAKEHFESLIRDLVETYGINTDIELDISITPVNFTMDTLLPLGLIINELINNSLKYAFKNKEKGKISIQIKTTTRKGFYELIIGDDGVGIEKGQTLKSNQIGANLVQAFVKQINGTITTLEGPGTSYRIIFKGV